MLKQELNIIEQNEQIQRKRRSFKCLLCIRYARTPVLTQCGHVFCWPCLFKSANTSAICPYCKDSCIISQCYPIYTDHQQDQQQPSQQQPNSQKQLSSPEIYVQPIKDIELPGRPSAKHHKKILNPNMIGAGLPLIANNLPSNVDMGIMIPGHVFVSPLGVNTFNSIEQGKQNQEDYQQGQSLKIKMHLVFVFVILAIIYSLMG